MKNTRTTRWLSVLAVVSIAGTAAYLQTRPPRFEKRFHRVIGLSDPHFPSVSSAVWIDNDTLLFVLGTNPYTVERLTLSERRMVIDQRLTSAINSINPYDFGGDSNGWAGASPDGKWLLLKYTPANDTASDVVRIISLVDGHTVSTDKIPYAERLVAWLPDSRHWVEITPGSMTTHNIDNRSEVKRTPVSLPKTDYNSANADGTYPFADVDLLHGGYGAVYDVTSTGRILAGGTSIDLTSNPVIGSHVVSLMANVVAPVERDTFFGTEEPWGCAGYSMCPQRGTSAYTMYDSGVYNRKNWLPSWVPLSSRPTYSYWLSDFSGRHPRLLAVATGEQLESDLASPGWSPDGEKLLVEYHNAIWEADVD